MAVGEPTGMQLQVTEAVPVSIHARRALLAALWTAIALAVVMAVAVPVFMVVADPLHVVGYISDDAYYYFNVAPHIGSGVGPSADGITRTTGFHPLYAFILAGIHRVTQPSIDGFVSQATILNALLHMAAAVFLYLGAARWWGRWAGIVVALLWLINPHAVKIRMAGLEGSLYAALLALVIWQVSVLLHRRVELSPARYLSASLWLGVSTGLMIVSRTDSMLLAPLLAVILWMAGARLPIGHRLLAVFLFATPAVLPFAAWLLYVHEHTGLWVQGSAAVKREWRRFIDSERAWYATAGASAVAAILYAMEVAVKVPALKWMASALPLLGRTPAGQGAPLLQRLTLHALWIFPLALGVAYAVMLDRVRSWYYVPGLITLTFLSAGAGVLLYRASTLNRLQRLAHRTLPLLAWLVLIESSAIFARDMVEGQDSEQQLAMAAASWLEKNVPPGTRVGCWHSGIVQYYTPTVDVINLDGLANNDILDILHGRKTLNEYWDEKGITVIVGEPREKMGHYKPQWNGKKLVGSRFPMIDLIVPVTQTQPSSSPAR